MPNIRLYVISIVTATVLLLLIFQIRTTHIENVIGSGSESEPHVSDTTQETLVESQEPIKELPKYAFATFLNPPMYPLEHDEDDKYFTQARMMAFQMLHNPETKTKKGYPLLILTSEGVRESKIERLRKDGATVMPVERITSDWLHTKNSQWWDQLTKLRLWQLTQFEKIAYLDTDNIVVGNMDDIFEDPTTDVVYNRNLPDKAPGDEGVQPSKYMLSASTSQGTFKHVYPPAGNKKTFNAGCFVLMPSEEVFNYYMKILSIEGRFPTKYMEQALLSYVHRLDGNMPWTRLTWSWNTNWAIYNDTLHGYKSLHSKWWENDYDLKLKELVYELKGKALGYYMGLDSASTS